MFGVKLPWIISQKSVKYGAFKLYLKGPISILKMLMYQLFTSVSLWNVDACKQHCKFTVTLTLTLTLTNNAPGCSISQPIPTTLTTWHPNKAWVMYFWNCLCSYCQLLITFLGVLRWRYCGSVYFWPAVATAGFCFSCSTACSLPVLCE